MRSLTLPSLAAACIAAYAISLPAAAQQRGNDAPPPPQLENLEEGEEPAVTIRKPEQERTTTTEKRGPGGKVTEVKVTTGGSTYYLRPNDQAGSTLPGEGQSNSARAAQWEVKTFDLIPQRDAQEAAAEQAAEVPAPPPAPEQK
jgi:Protein of unknown function (DUF2782)